MIATCTSVHFDAGVGLVVLVTVLDIVTDILRKFDSAV